MIPIHFSHCANYTVTRHTIFLLVITNRRTNILCLLSRKYIFYLQECAQLEPSLNFPVKDHLY